MASTVLDPVAAKILVEIEALTFADGNGNTQTCKGYQRIPREYDSLPAAAIGIPSIERVGPDEAESQLGTNDWFIDYPVELAVDLADPVYAQATLVGFVEAFVKAIDANQQLTNTVLDAKVVRAEPFVEDNRAKPIIGYEATVRVWKLV